MNRVEIQWFRTGVKVQEGAGQRRERRMIVRAARRKKWRQESRHNLISGVMSQSPNDVPRQDAGRSQSPLSSREPSSCPSSPCSRLGLDARGSPASVCGCFLSMFCSLRVTLKTACPMRSGCRREVFHFAASSGLKSWTHSESRSASLREACRGVFRALHVIVGKENATIR